MNNFRAAESVMEILHQPAGDDKQSVPFIHRSAHNDKLDQFSNYYLESRGPILKVQARRAEVLLTFDPIVLDYIEDVTEERCFKEELELFSTTTKGKETRIITMKNEGTTTIRFQWMRFPPSAATCAMLANPADVFDEHGKFTDILKLKPKESKTDEETQETDAIIKDNDENAEEAEAEETESQAILEVEGMEGRIDEKISKRSTLEFRFRELPSVLLPGQSLEFPIVFRSQRTGYFYESLYLLTHPILKDAELRSYAIRLTGICMDHDLLSSDEMEYRDKNIEERIQSIVLEQESLDLMDSVLDRALFVKPEPITTQPQLQPSQPKKEKDNKTVEEMVRSRILEQDVLELISSVMDRVLFVEQPTIEPPPSSTLSTF